jgi:hypothetical protein
MIEVMVTQSSAAKNSWSLSIEKYNASPAPTITGNEHINRLMIDSKEKGMSLFKDISLIENWSLSNSLLWTILYILKFSSTLNTKKNLSVQQ